MLLNLWNNLMIKGGCTVRLIKSSQINYPKVEKEPQKISKNSWNYLKDKAKFGSWIFQKSWPTKNTISKKKIFTSSFPLDSQSPFFSSWFLFLKHFSLFTLHYFFRIKLIREWFIRIFPDWEIQKNQVSLEIFFPFFRQYFSSTISEKYFLIHLDFSNN